MIGLDTNVVLRLFVDDDQSDVARAFVARRCTRVAPGFVNLISLCELVWVLGRVHRYDRRTIGSVLTDLLDSDDIVVEESTTVTAALAIFLSGGAGFADILIGQLNRARGCDATATFDRVAARLPTFARVTSR